MSDMIGRTEKKKLTTVEYIDRLDMLNFIRLMRISGIEFTHISCNSNREFCYNSSKENSKPRVVLVTNHHHWMVLERHAMTRALDRGMKWDPFNQRQVGLYNHLYYMSTVPLLVLYNTMLLLRKNHGVMPMIPELFESTQLEAMSFFWGCVAPRVSVDCIPIGEAYFIDTLAKNAESKRFRRIVRVCEPL
jgi:hypothetical protein